MSNRKPVAMNFKVGRFAFEIRLLVHLHLLLHCSRIVLKQENVTYYAGNKRILNAAATRAH